MTAIRRTVEKLEKDIENLEEVTPQSPKQPGRAKKRLGSFLQDQAKGALVRGCFMSVQDMDGPMRLFFRLGKSTEQKSIMMGLQKSNGTVTSDPATMTEEVEAFYTNLYRAEDCCGTSVAELLDNLPQLSPADRDTLGSTITLQEL